MKVNKHIIFGQEKLPELIIYLDVHGVSYKNLDTTIVFDIFDDDVRWKDIEQYVADQKVTCLSETYYTKEELAAARWLILRSTWRNGYPQPESGFGYRNMTYATADYCAECGCGLIQSDSFRLKTIPKWGTRHIFTLNWVDEELFVDDTAMSILKKNGLSGFHFLPVKNKRGNAELPGVQQLVIENTSMPGIILGNADIDHVYKCEVCGNVKYHPTGIGMHAFSKEALCGMPDICHSYEYFGWGHGADRLILVRQSVYQTLINHHLARNLEFEPIILV